MSPFTCDNYNYTATILNRTKRHDDFIIPPDLQECRIDTENFEDQCDYLSRTSHDNCFEHVNYIDYVTFLFCFGTRSSYHYGFSFAIIIIFCVYLFVILGITADQFFCPVLTVIAKTLKMSESLAGVTILAFGNGAPDLFMALSNPYGDMELIYNELLGGGSFVISVIGGSIIIYRSFHMPPFKIARDCLFLMLVANYMGYAIHDKVFTYKETFIIIFIYIGFIAIVLIERWFEKGGEIEIERYVTDPDAERHSLIRQVYVSLNPFADYENDDSIVSRVLLALQSPVIIILRILIPVIDYTLERDGWSKLLNMVHCIIMPQFFLLITGLYRIYFGPIPLCLIFFILSLPFSIVLGLFTTKDDIPKYHIFIAFLTFVGSILVIQTIAGEIMAVLSVIGQATGLSHSILGITILSWGNSVGDLVSNLVLARKGYARFGFAGCFGGAMFNILTGIGITFILKISAASNRVAYGRSGAMGPNCTVFMFLLLIFVLVAFILTNFYARRVIGVYMLTIYVIFILFCCLNEAEIIHPIGTDHSDQLKIQFGTYMYGD